MKTHEARQHRRHERPHRLSEHVAERQQIEEADRQKRPGPLPVLRDLPLDRHDVGEDVPVGDDDALGVGGGAGREDDLRRIVRRQIRDQVGWRLLRRGASHLCIRGMQKLRSDLGQRPHRAGGIGQRGGVDDLAGEDGAGADDLGDARQKRCRRAVVDGDENHALEQAAPERDDPFGPVLAPDGDRLRPWRCPPRAGVPANARAAAAVSA